METDDCVFNNDVKYMQSLIGKTVEINTQENHAYTGTVYVIDPESKTVVLATTSPDNSTSLEFIFHHAITSLAVVPGSAVNQDFLYRSEKAAPRSGVEMEKKRAQLKEWLKSNLIDVQEEGSNLKVGNALIIEPPYGCEQCLSSNTLVLERIQTLIRCMSST